MALVADALSVRQESSPNSVGRRGQPPLPAFFATDRFRAGASDSCPSTPYEAPSTSYKVASTSFEVRRGS